MSTFVRRYSDLVLAALVVGIVAMMIIPLPTRLLDVLIALNISLSVILLLVAIYITQPLRIATFPTLLLITTLFRLGLNVSSTRLILIQADAGEVIRSFGNFVVAGNLVVGAVVFLILTVIQFLVIAKGSERVAEVAARFTLDAMPGKQMSIDADLRAGLLDPADARRRRAHLERESQLYGAMDGAMKFVKGDAIAGIVITLVNIVGGLVIGVMQLGMSAGEAAETYALLTIGDGLVSQIPALILSTAAGLLITRVAAEDEGSHLGQEIGAQILGQPKAIAIAALLMAALALIPGLPFFPFMVLSVLCGVTAYVLLRRVEPGRPASARDRPGGLLGALVGPAEPPLDRYEEGATGPPRGLVEPVALELSAGLAARLGPGGDELADRVSGTVRERLFHELGVAVPAVAVRLSAAAAPEGGYRILVKEVPLAEVTLPPDRVLALAPATRVSAVGLAAEPVDWLGLESGLCLVPVADAGRLQELGIGVLEAADTVALHLEAVLRRYAHEFVGIQETRALLDALESTHPHLVSELVPRPVTVPLLAEVLRRLVEERINVRHLADILPALASWSKTEKDPVLLTEYCRMALRRQITHRFADASGALSAVVVAPEIEQTLAESIRRSEAGSYLALEPALGQEILAAARTACQPCLDAGQPPVLLTSMETRRFLRKLLEVELPDAIVLSYQELAPDLAIEPIGRLSI